MSVEEQRRQYRYMTDKFPEPHVDVESVEDQKIPGPHGDIPIRIYRPSNEIDLPVLVYYHGGGWVIGDLETHDSVCRNLSKAADIVVVSVDYRLAPEHKFPIPFDDCYTATQWVVENAEALKIDGKRLAVGGDSAGGNLAAAITLKARDEGGPSIKYQLLIYPATDGSQDTQSKIDFKEGYLLSKHDMEFFGSAYISNESDYLNPLISPLLASDHTKLPPAFVFTAGFDPLRDEGKAYADKLKSAGVAVDYKNYEGTIHGFFGKGKFKQSNVAMKDSVEKLKSYL